MTDVISHLITAFVFLVVGFYMGQKRYLLPPAYGTPKKADTSVVADDEYENDPLNRAFDMEPEEERVSTVE